MTRMTSFLLVAFMMNIINVYSASLCIAGIASNAARGTFIDSSSTNNGKTYWMLDNSDQTDCSPAKFYIFYSQAFDGWYIDDELHAANSIEYYFNCTTAISSMSDPNDPSTCLNWQGANPQTDYGAMVNLRNLTSGGCGGPALCSTITLSTDAGSCSGTLNYVAPNQYVDAEQDYMIYNEKYEAWFCVNNIASYWGCQDMTFSWGSGTETGFKQPFSNGDSQTYNGVQFTCNGAETTTTAAATTTAASAATTAAATTTTAAAATTTTGANAATTTTTSAATTTTTQPDGTTTKITTTTANAGNTGNNTPKSTDMTSAANASPTGGNGDTGNAFMYNCNVWWILVDIAFVFILLLY